MNQNENTPDATTADQNASSTSSQLPHPTQSSLADKRNALLHAMPQETTDRNTSAAHNTPQQPEKFTETTSASDDTKKERSSNKAVVHTFKDDVQNLIQTQDLSMTKIRALESDRAPREATRTTQTNSIAGTLMAAIVGLAIISSGIIGGWYYFTIVAAPAPTPSVPLAVGLFFTEGYETADMTGATTRGAREALAVVRKRGAFSLGSLVEVVPVVRVRDEATGDFVQQRLTTRELVRALGLRMQELFAQTLGASYMVGIHVGDENIPYAVLTTNSYDHAFAGMLQWEKNIEEDFAPFMSPNASYTKPAAATGGNVFVDTVVRNFDVRILRDDTGTIRIVHGFVGKNIIIITTRVETFLSIAERLRVERQ